jgi:hypothetical protein
MCVSSYYYMCPHTPMCVSSHYDTGNVPSSPKLLDHAKGVCSCMLTYVCWRTPKAYVHICSRVITHAHVSPRLPDHAKSVCSRMLTYAESVCSRMLTYADVSPKLLDHAKLIEWLNKLFPKINWIINEFSYCLLHKWHQAPHGIVCLLNQLVCWRMLTYADVCWRMLTYADVCWRMLTYANVCW